MAKDAKTTGPTAERVAANVRQLREARGLGLAGLAGRLGELGQPMTVGTLSKLELGARRVDVDDLVALAVALDVSPSRLLLGAGADVDRLLPLTPAREVTEDDAWRWAAGDAPLPVPQGHAFDLDGAERFTAESRPHDPVDQTTVTELSALAKGGHLTGLRDGYRAALAAGLSHDAVLAYLDLTRTMGELVGALGGVDDEQR